MVGTLEQATSGNSGEWQGRAGLGRPIRGQGRSKNSKDKSHDIYETKEDTGGVSGKSHDVIENKEPTLEGA
jgi:hypothetical protein